MTNTPPVSEKLTSAKILSPLRVTSRANDIESLALEQLEHFGITPDSDYGRTLYQTAKDLYHVQGDVTRLCQITTDTIATLDKKDRIAYFNAKKFLSFQVAKILHGLQTPFREANQSLTDTGQSTLAKGPYPIFDNVTALFSATPVVTRTACYIYACTEWVDEAFKGKELLHDIYSRLLNPTSTTLAHHMVDVEAGPYANEYFAWNFNSGMAALDTLWAHVLGHQDIVLASRNIYGGNYQLLNDWYCKPSNLGVAIRWFDGHTAEAFAQVLKNTKKEYKERLASGRKVYVFLESPCNPHGHVLDVAGISRVAHEAGLTVICDSTVGTPVLQPVLRREDPVERPDYVIHSYTKDIAGSGVATAGVCIARNEHMFIPKGQSATASGPDGTPITVNWDETLFWNVYYIKGAFLEAEKAFEVLNGMRTMELRIISKSINTIVLARALAMHPEINVNCPAVSGNENEALCKENMFLGLPAPLFSIDFEGAPGSEPPIDTPHFKRLFDNLEPAFGHQLSLGQSNTIVSCPALTSHSELSEDALKDADITPTTIRVSVGNEDPRTLIAHFVEACNLILGEQYTDFVTQFPDAAAIDTLYEEVYLDVHRRLIKSRPSMTELLT